MSAIQKAYSAALLYALITGFALMIVKIALTFATPLDTLAHRFTLSFIAASILILFKKEKVMIKWKDVLAMLPLALLFPTSFFGFQAFGLAYTSSSEAGIIQATVPVFTLLLAAYFLNETSTKLQKAAIILSVAGVAYLFIMKGLDVTSDSLKGAVFILFTALSNAMYNVLARKAMKQYSVFELTYIMIFVGFLSFNSAALIMHQQANTLHTFLMPLTQIDFLLAVAYLGILSSLATALLSNYALATIQASQMSVFTNLATLISIAAGVAILHEQLHYFHIIGAITIILGVIGTTYKGKETDVITTHTISKEK
ncbi:DMT family transporter [Priestia megaterium]|nr:DMT family transporter [Priestia megaterium]